MAEMVSDSGGDPHQAGQVDQATIDDDSDDSEFGDIVWDPAFDDCEFANPEIAEFLDLLPKAVIDDNWTQEDEDALVAAWEEHPLKREIDAACRGYDGVELTRSAWLRSLTALGVPPTEVIGLDKNMLAIPSLDKVDERREMPRLQSSTAGWLLWEPWFSDALRKLVTHPAWLRRPELLRLAIQYTVVCATDDRRPWQVDEGLFKPFDPFLWRFVKDMRENTSNIPPEDVHAAAWNHVSNKFNISERTWWSRLFLAIESQTKLARELKRKAGRSLLYVEGDDTTRVPYLVEARDLEDLELAIRSGADFGVLKPMELEPEQIPTFLSSRLLGRALNRVWMSWYRLFKQGKIALDLDFSEDDGSNVAAKEGNVDNGGQKPQGKGKVPVVINLVSDDDEY
jgi:hypothetical protein